MIAAASLIEPIKQGDQTKAASLTLETNARPMGADEVGLSRRRIAAMLKEYHKTHSAESYIDPDPEPLPGAGNSHGQRNVAGPRAGRC